MTNLLLCLIAQSCLTLCDTTDCSLPGSALRILQSRILEWVAMPSLQGIFQTQGSNPGVLHCRQILYYLSHLGNSRPPERVAYPFSRGSSWPRNWTGVSCIAGRFFIHWDTREAHKPRQHITKQRHYFPDKGPFSQATVFPELDHKENWVLKNCCFWTVVLEKTLESPLDCKEIKPVNPKVNQSWVFTGRTDAEAEAPILWPPDAKSWLIRKDPDAEKDWRQEKKGTTEDEMAGSHHWLNGHEFE